MRATPLLILIEISFPCGKEKALYEGSICCAGPAAVGSSANKIAPLGGPIKAVT